MKVSKKLHLNTAASAMMILIVALVLSVGLYRIDKAFEELDAADEILISLFKRATLLHDYLMTGNERAKEQWFAEHAYIDEALGNALAIFEQNEDKNTIRRMIKDNEATARLFTGIVENREKTSSGSIAAELSESLDNRYLTQANVRLYDKILNVQELRAAARQRVFTELRRTSMGIAAIVLIAAAVTAIGAWTLGRVITRRISRLRQGSAIIGQGDLDHRIDITGDDEFAEFSSSFNAMTEKLKISYLALKNEITDRKRAEEALHRLNETLEQRVSERTEMAEARSRQLQALAMELIEAEEQERRRIAQMLHDDLQQMLAAAKMQLQAVSDGLPNNAMLKNVGQILEESIAKSRRLSHELSPAVLHHSGLLAGLQWLCGQMSEQFGMQITLNKMNDMPSVNTTLKVFLFRAVQEMLFNIIKHAGVQKARIDLAITDDRFILTVSDQGRGFDPAVLEKANGFGLLTVKERAEYFAGKLSIESTPGHGSHFTLTIPLNMLNSKEEASVLTPVQKVR